MCVWQGAGLQTWGEPLVTQALTPKELETSKWVCSMRDAQSQRRLVGTKRLHSDHKTRGILEESYLKGRYCANYVKNLPANAGHTRDGD